ncbi:pilus assembly protein PilA [Hahella sp. CCB-MM4]|uniref:NINE protein n=1 Tax=Hahella sp. (strain CCB-MM4) TaxID=1926491 RepID=UPI000B9A3296|nr:NINE protein [Hahella sp. CCB-MM4]OZG72997.1 pilus assembly protein PilA [Hahella sp. CCB-MM4]
MSDSNVDIVLLGQCQPGVDVEEALPRLAKLFKTDAAVVRKMMAKGRQVIKKGVDQAMAEKYRVAIERAGGSCELVGLPPQAPELSVLPIDEPSVDEPPLDEPRMQEPAAQIMERSAQAPKNEPETQASQTDSMYRTPAAQVDHEPEVFCRHCGASISPKASRCPVCDYKQIVFHSKNKYVAGVLAILLGGFGVHRFYLGQWWGIFYLLFAGSLIPSIISLIEAIVFFVTPQERWERKYGKVPSSAGVIVAAIVGVFLFIMMTGILAAVAIPAYQDYITRARVAGAFPLVIDTRDKVSEFIQTTGFYPNQNLDANLPEHIGNEVVDIQVIENAVIVATFNIKTLGSDNTIELEPVENNGQIEWTCYGGTMLEKYRVAECRGGGSSSLSRSSSSSGGSDTGGTNASNTGRTNTSSSGSELGQTARSKDGRLSLDIPASWDRMDQLNEEASLGVGNVFEDAYYLILEEPKLDFEDGYTLTAYTDLIQSLMFDALKSPNIVYEREAVMVGDLPAEQMAFTGSAEGIKVTYLLTTIEGKDHYYQVIGWSLASKFDEKADLLRNIAGSFREGKAINRGVK